MDLPTEIQFLFMILECTDLDFVVVNLIISFKDMLFTTVRRHEHVDRDTIDVTRWVTR
jgi:hypothetical protein